jgi:two-component system, NtrC family, sensor kinase
VTRESARLAAATPHYASLIEVAIEHLNDAVLVTEGDEHSPRRIVYVNPAFTAMTGYTSEEALGSTPDLTVGPGTDRSALRRIQRARDERRPIREELLKYRKDGSTFWVEIDVVPVVGPTGAVVHYLAVMRDVTARKALDARAIEADRLASLGTLVAGIAHEINNPLSYILANLNFVAEVLAAPACGGEPPPDLRLPSADVVELNAALREVSLGAERVQRIVRDLRVFSRSEEAPLGPVDLAQIIDASLRLARAELTERIAVVRDVHPTRVLGDESRLGQVVLNVLLNAAQAIVADLPRAGRIEIVSRREGPTVRLEIVDNGVGISRENLARVFQPFFTTKPIGVGTGLGLPICQRIVTSLGGRLTLASELGAGTTVTIELPAVD